MTQSLLVPEVSVAEHGRGDHGPEVDGRGQPAGDDLDPHSGRVAGVGREVIGALGVVPVGEGHHDVEGGESEHEVEEAPAVVHPVVLVVPGGGTLLTLRDRAGLGVGQVNLAGEL